MNNRILLSIHKNRSFLIWTFLIICYLTIQLPFLTDMRPILCDEPWYANSGYNFLIGNGFINTNVGSGANANFILPLLIAFSFKLFGVSLFSARIVAVIAGMFFLYGVRKIFMLIRVDDKYQFLVLTTIIITSHFVSLFRYARPECLSVTFLLLSVIPFLKYYIDRNFKQIIFVSIFLMLSFLSHPFTGVFFGIYGIYFLYDVYRYKEVKLWKYLIVFTALAFLSVFLLFSSNMLYNHLALDNLISRTTLVHSSFSIKERILVFIRFWFLSSRIIFSLPFLLVLLHGFFLKQKIAQTFSIFGITYLLAALIIFGNDLGMTTYIFNYSIVFSVLIIPFSLEYFERVISRKRIVLIFFISYFPINLGASIFNNIQKYEHVNSRIENELPKKIPIGKNVLGPIEFWFSIPHSNYMSYFYPLQILEEYRNRFDYVIVKEKDNFDIPGKFGVMINDTTKYKEIYAFKNSKNYGNIVLYKKK
jgi:Dolichyl-phosphate-mannose-protein mannosyltransferase